MIAFQHKSTGRYLLTNYKVMFSSLDHQPNSKRVGKLAFFWASISKRLAISKLRCVVVVRNPYDRVTSFYKDKFVRAEDYRLWMQGQGMSQSWQQSTQLFFPYLGLDSSMDPKSVSERLSVVTFEEFMEILPKVYLQDGHLTPQYLAGAFSFRFLSYRISFRLPLYVERIYKMESLEDIESLSKDFQLELKTKVNTTEKVEESITWTPSSIKTVKRLYARDFKRFGYERRTDTTDNR